MADLSVIMPYVNEWPQVAFTIRSVSEILKNRVDFEIIAIDNYTADVELQGFKPDRGHSRYIGNNENEYVVSHIKSMAEYHPWLKYVRFEGKLSHWNAKRAGVNVSTGSVLLFLDSHVIPSQSSLSELYHYYVTNYEELNGTLHLPLTYHILEAKRLKYKLKWEPEKGILHYGFTGFGESMQKKAVEVPCMSTCGMMISRTIYEDVGGWDSEFGIYGGGENYMNFVLAILGYSKSIYPCGNLYHHGEKRGYAWNGDDYVRNRGIATYCFGGKEMASKYVMSNPGDQRTLRKIFASIIPPLLERRRMIKKKQKIELEEWVAKWWGK